MTSETTEFVMVQCKAVNILNEYKLNGARTVAQENNHPIGKRTGTECIKLIKVKSY